MPLLVNMQPAGEYLGEEYHRAGGVPAVVNELMRPAASTRTRCTVNGKTDRRELPRPSRPTDRQVIRPFDKPLRQDAGFIVLQAAISSTARS